MKKKPSPAAQARAALDPGPSPPSTDDSDVLLPLAKRTITETARPPPHRVKLINTQTVCELVNLTYPTIWKMMQEGKFPRARELMDGRIAWIESEVQQWIEKLPIRRFKGDEVP